MRSMIWRKNVISLSQSSSLWMARSALLSPMHSSPDLVKIRKSLSLIIKRMITGILQSAVVFFLIGLFTTKGGTVSEALFDAFLVDQVSVYAGLVFFGLLFAPVKKLLSIYGNYGSRKDEFEADAYAANAQQTSEHLVQSLKKLSADNLVNLTI